MTEARAFTCPACGHEDTVTCDPTQEILQCTECASRIVYGVARPRVVIDPHEDARFRIVRVRYVGKPEIVHVFDKDFAFAIGQNLVSVSR